MMDYSETKSVEQEIYPGRCVHMVMFYPNIIGMINQKVIVKNHTHHAPREAQLKRMLIHYYQNECQMNSLLSRDRNFFGLLWHCFKRLNDFWHFGFCNSLNVSYPQLSEFLKGQDNIASEEGWPGMGCKGEANLQLPLSIMFTGSDYS